MSIISNMFRFLLGRRQPPPVYYNRCNYGGNATTYTAQVGAKIIKG